MSTGRDYRKLTTPRNRSSLSGGAGWVIGLALGGVLAFFSYQQGNHLLTCFKIHTAYATCCAAHRTHIIFIEAHRFA